MDLIEHINKNYGKITDKNRTSNEDRMKMPWMPPTPIERLFNQLLDGRDYALQGKETITESTMVRWGYDIILATGLFTSERKKWSKKAHTDKTWDAFRIYFKEADTTRQEHNVTTSGEKSYTMNQVEEMLQSQITAWTTQYQDKENWEPEPVQTQTVNVVTGITESQVHDIIKSALGDHNDQHPKRTNCTNPNRKDKPKAQALIDGIPVTYCWSHSVTQNLFHSNCTCKSKKEGHKDEATYDNRMGGTDMVQAQRNIRNN